MMLLSKVVVFLTAAGGLGLQQASVSRRWAMGSVATAGVALVVDPAFADVSACKPGTCCLVGKT